MLNIKYYFLFHFFYSEKYVTVSVSYHSIRLTFNVHTSNTVGLNINDSCKCSFEMAHIRNALNLYVCIRFS